MLSLRTMCLISGVGIFLSLVQLLLGLFFKNESLTTFYSCQLFIFYGVSLWYSIRRYGAMNIFSLLLITTFIFTFGGIFLTPFTDLIDYKYYDSPWATLRYDEKIIQKVLAIYTLYINCFVLFYNLISRNTLCEKANIKIPLNGFFLRVGKYTMILFLPFALYFSYTQMQLVFQNRTLLFQLGSNAELGIPLYLRLTNLFFQVGYFLMIASVPSKKTFLSFSFLYFCSVIPILLMGERGDIAALILFIIWYMSKMYDTKFSFKKLGMLAVIMMLVFQILAYTRTGSEVENTSFFFLIIMFLFSQSQSFNILALYLSYNIEKLPHNYPYFLDSCIGGLMGVSGQSLETLSVRSSIGHHLVYYLNPDYYLAGASLGTSFVTEIYEFKYVGVILGALALAYFMYFVEYKMMKTPFLLIFLFDFFTIILLSPRGSLLPSIYFIIKYTLVALVLITMSKILTRKKNII
ncbi:O-antigen polysaccharide polymerase Wzy [Parabacteroides pacaensis]|uniref:O-antigen polysaccharide polymerase Wzy n=1 Tax=Parabacteroides pacaensis TaxID=2086575 RepID=UPI000D0F0F25|nr:O-antigen polysaccharide polymerase Wzy [Parabacteroides pacaensis]